MSERPATSDQRPFLATDAAKVDIPRIRPDLQHRPATVELAFGSHCLWPPLSTFSRNTNVREVALDGMAICDFNCGPNGDRQVIGEIDGDVASRSFQRGIEVANGHTIKSDFSDI